MKIFLSSTIYDLEDIRSGVSEELKKDGHEIIASDEGTVIIKSGKHSYDQCLDNVSSCDCLIAIIGGRFGGKYSFDSERSITEAEIEKAYEEGKSVFVFVRKTVWDNRAYQYGEGRGKEGIPYKAVEHIVEDPEVLYLIDRIRRKPQDNWIFRFNSQADLLIQIRCQIKSKQKNPNNLVGENTNDEKSIKPNFFSYNETWVGRENLIEKLSDLMKGSCRLMVIVGITGIGKTALGERLAIVMKDWLSNDWSQFYQENFESSNPTDFTSVATRCLEKWGLLVEPDLYDKEKKEFLIDNRFSIEKYLMYHLIRNLRNNRYFIQIDSLEIILQNNEDNGWDEFKDHWWIEFFTSYLGGGDSCQSCIILTSQSLPGELQQNATHFQNFWHHEILDGLKNPERLDLFKKNGLDISGSNEKKYLERIGNAYEGHPLALRIVAGEIMSRPFCGNILAYWNKYGSEVEEIERAAMEAQKGESVGEDDNWQIHRFTTVLQRSVQSRLEKTFKRLEKDAYYSYIMLCEASIYRSPVPEDFWLSHLKDWDRNKDEQKVALQILRERYLLEEVVVEKNNLCLLRQHNLIRALSLSHRQKLDVEYE
jgi:Domain of unknown function (DUF4062)